MNKFYAHINVTESYCRDANIKGSVFIEMMKSVLDMLKPNILPKCPVKGHVGPIDLKSIQPLSNMFHHFSYVVDHIICDSSFSQTKWRRSSMQNIFLQLNLDLIRD
jgi:hypothetical protein